MLEPVASGVLIIIIVFVPLLALQGLEGKLFIPVALAIIFALGRLAVAGAHGYSGSDLVSAQGGPAPGTLADPTRFTSAMRLRLAGHWTMSAR